MRLVSAAIALLTWHVAPSTIHSVVAQQCVSGAFTLEFEGTCDYETILEEYTRQVFEATGSVDASCGATTAKQDLDNKLAGTSIDAICGAGHDNAKITPFYAAARRGTDMAFEQLFYNGRSDWQEEVETNYESVDGTPTKVLKEDASAVNDFYKAAGTYGRVQWPNMLTNFDDSTCSTNTAMCCWPKDRQAGDNNGNCARPYDTNCVDKDPADNTDLCFVDFSRGKSSNEFNSNEGFAVFPGGNDDGEGPIHCHGFAWANDDNDPISRYKANNLFYVSMYDHMYQRGYVREIPGAPMCACLEQMPVVSRSDCTQVDLTESFKLVYDGSTFAVSVTKSEIDFNSCQGRNGRNNDLWAYAARLYDEGKMTNEQFGKVGRIITNDGCDVPTEYFFNEEGYTRGFDHDKNIWTKVAGRESLKEREPFGREAFYSSLFEDSLTAPNSPNASPLDNKPIILRVCATCEETHRFIYYRRLTPIGDSEFDLLNNLLYKNNDGGGENVWNQDFTLHSSYEDALVGANAWACPNNIYNYGSGFPGNCSPDGSYVGNQNSYFDNSWGPRKDVAFFVNKPDSAGVQEYNIISSSSLSSPTDIDIGPVRIPGMTMENNDVYYITASGQINTWSQSDQFHYLSEPMSGDVQMEVFVSSFANIANSWAKAGIMIRADNDDDSEYAFAFLSGSEGISFQSRTSKQGYPRTIGDTYKTSPVQTQAWLRLIKQAEKVEMWYSDDGVSWNFHAEATVFFPNDSFRVGLAVASNNNYVLSEATFENYSASAYAFPTSAPSTSQVPTSWEAAVDIGEVQKDGEYIPENTSTGITTFKGSGTGIWGRNDSFFFYNEQRSNMDDFEVTCLVENFNNWFEWSKGGIMVRDSNNPNSAHAFVAVTGKNQGVAFQSRQSTDAPTSHHAYNWVKDNKVWLKLTKDGGSFSAYYKHETMDDWVLMGSSTISLSPNNVQVGIAVTAGDTSSWAQATLELKEFEIVG